MQISQLPGSASFSNNDVIAIEINGVTYKITGANLAAALKTIGSYAKTDNASANALVNALAVGADTPVDDDYFISQYVNGGTTDTNYYRRKISTLWTYMNGKASQVSSVSVGDSTYISSVSGGYIKVGRLVVFSVAYTMRAAINQSVNNAVAGLPSAVNYGRFLVYDNASTYDFSTPRFANISGTGLAIKGPHTAGDTYYVSGAYISAS